MIKLISTILFISAFYYLIYPSSSFPNPPPAALQSFEPADTETPNRRAYYTNLSRQEVISYYKNNFGKYSFRLNYPPEESQSIVRDQTRSSWLEELYLPWRDSLLINGWYPTKPTEQININGTHYLNKISIRYIPNHPITRLTILLFAAITSFLLIKEYA